MRAVHEAEQDNPRRPVALKIVRPGFASPPFLKRFRHEAQILGRLHYPGIAQEYELVEAVQLILEEDPPRLGSLNPELHGDVETIVAKALEKDRSRRYASAADLAADLRRWLAHEPILARPSSALYHLRKFARRHRGLVGGMAATGVALILGLIGTILFAVAEARQRGQAEQNAQAALDEKREALFQAYRASLAAASAALESHDVADVARHLQSAPEALRGWEWRHLNSRLDDSSAVVPLPAERGGFLIPAADRLRIGILTNTGLRITDLDGSEYGTIPLGPEHRDHVSVAHTSCGIRVAAWVGNKAFDLLNDAGQVLRRVAMPHHKGQGSGQVVVSPNGTRLACIVPGDDRKWVILFDATSGKQTAICQHDNNIDTLTFSPDSTRLASGSADRTARVWDAATGALQATCRGHSSTVASTGFSPDGTRLVTSSPDGTVRQWDARTGQEVEPAYDRHSSQLFSAVYSPDGHLIASAGDDRTIRVWRARSRQDVAVLHGHTGCVVQVAFTPDGGQLTSLSSRWGNATAWDSTMRIWDVDPQATLPVLRGHTRSIYPLAYSPDGRWLASGSWDGTVRLWDATTGEQCATLPHPSLVASLAFGPDGNSLVTGCNQEDRLRVWDLASARVRKEIPFSARNTQLLTVSPDGTRVAALDFDWTSGNRLAVLDLASSKSLFAAAGSPLAYSPDGRWLAAVAEDEKTVLLLDPRTHETVARFRGHARSVFKAAFSPDSRYLASCGKDRTVRLWQISSGGCQELRGHTDEVYAIAFHPDGTRLATAGRDGAVWLWDVARAEAVARLPRHKSFVWSLAFSLDGATLASGSGDTTIRLWDTAPLKTRYQARRAAAVLRPEAERLVEQLWREKNDPTAVVDALRANSLLSASQRQAALRAVLQRPKAREATPSNPHTPP